MKILITGCNRLRKSVVEALKNNRDGRAVSVIGIDSSEKKILRDAVDEFHVAPRIDSEGYADWLTELCKRKSIDIVMARLTEAAEDSLWNGPEEDGSEI